MEIRLLKFLPAITIRFIGEANTSWTEHFQHSYRDNNGHQRIHTEYIRAKAHQGYFDKSYFVYQSDVGEQFSPGSCIFPFELTLPKETPSSFEHKCGHIRYTIKAAINWKIGSWQMYRVKTMFIVNAQLQLRSSHMVSDVIYL